MKKLKYKIFASFMLLVALLAVAGAISILEFNRLSQSVHGLIDDNYKSIEASKTMLDALEREDSAILLLMLGERTEGRSILQSADQSFLRALEVARNNLTEDNEARYIEAIEEQYALYKVQWKNPIVDTEKQNNISWYKNQVHVAFSDTKSAINALMALNQMTMYQQAADVRERSQRAMMPGIISILSALVFSLLLNFFISRYFVKPITDLSKAVNNLHEGDMELRSNIKSNDEIKGLERAINNLLSRVTSR
ncbi:MAG: MCP four helix bundle domain-containing protein [Bacteroidales bacterium]